MVFAGLVNHPRIHGALPCTVGDVTGVDLHRLRQAVAPHERHGVKVTFALRLDAPSLAVTTS
jgi:hypothetical protein